jgi:O-antigen ligase
VSRFRAGATSVALGAALAGVAFGARAGTELERTSIVELLLVATGALAIAAALLTAPRARVAGAPAVVAFAALAALTALSISWSIAPDRSYVETGRTLAYLATFAGAVAAARLAPAAAPAVVRGVLLASVTVAAYGLAARVWPTAFDENALGGRIGLPFDYWNALAGMAAIGVVPALWLGTRRNGGALGRALAYPALGLLLTTILITQSRGALVATVIACVAWLAIVPLRLRSLVLAGTAAAAGAPVAAWALSKDPFRRGMEPLSAREAIAGDFGLLLAAMLFVLLAAGLLVSLTQARRQPSLRFRTRSGIAVAAVAALVSLGLLTSVAMSDRGLPGTVSDRVDDLTSESGPPVGGARLGSTSSSRSGYWDEASSAFEERPVAGLGAGSFELARLRYRDTGQQSAYAHGFVAQTLADLGLAGLLAALAALVAWAAAAARATGLDLPRRGARPPWTTERTALVALGLATIAYGVQSLVDWTWFVPGLTVTALVAAGYLAGRGPLAQHGSAAAPLPVARAPQRPSAARLVATGGVIATSLLCMWTIWQPAAAERAVARSYALLDEGRPGAALAEARKARDHDPYSSQPDFAEAAARVDQGRKAAALGVLRHAVVERPRDPQPWVSVAIFQLHVLDSPEAALRSITSAFRVDPQSQSLAAIRDQATKLIIQRGGIPPSTAAL